VPTRAPTNAALGRAIRRLRNEQGLSIEVLALDAGLHPTYLSGIERGVRNPTWSKLCDLADTLNVPVSAIAGEAEHDICPACGKPMHQLSKDNSSPQSPRSSQAG
jgi:transcriptional regulator with XRE-family HTH domain